MELTQREAEPHAHPIRLSSIDDLRRSRVTVFFRLILLIPHLVWLALWGIAVWFAFLVGWFAALFTGRLPDGIHRFAAGYARYFTAVCAYGFLPADPFSPVSGREGGYPMDAEMDPPDGIEDLGTYALRYELQTAGHTLLLTGQYPSLSGGPTA